MSQSIKQKPIIDYPFGNPQSEQEQDTESYHSVNNDDRKFKYFDDEGQSSFYKKGSQSMLRKKNPLPPLYPYQQIQKLKESMKLQKKDINQSQGNQGTIFDTHSVRSVDSFHTANQFQSICYQEGDYEKIVGQMGQNEQDKKSQELRKKQQNQNDGHKQQQKIQSGLGSFEGRDFRYECQIDRGQLKMQMQKSNALDEAQLLQLEDSQLSQQRYEKFDQKDREQRIEVRREEQFRQKTIQRQIERQQKRQQKQQKVFNPVQQDQKSVEISRIQQVLNQSVQLDQEILQLTRQLEQAHSSQQDILMQKRVDRQMIKSDSQFIKSNSQLIKSDALLIKRQEQLNSRYQSIEKRIFQLQKSQKSFTKQVATINEILKRTQQSNNYLKKQVQFFKQKVKQHQQKQQQQQRKQKQLKSNNNNNGSFNKSIQSSSIFSSIQKKLKPKTYNIRPKTANNQSYQSRKYKQLTFQYCNSQQQLKNREQQKWVQLDIDRENNPSQYKIVYSFQQQNTLLVIRLVDMQVQTKNNKDDNKPFPIPIIKKNYQYMMDFAHNKYQNQQQKLQSLTKQLILHLNDQSYSLKQFTKKIQLFLIITEEQTYIDLVKIVPLPNPISFYIEKRFNLLLENNMNKIKQKSKSPQHSKNEQQRQQNQKSKRQQRSSLEKNNVNTNAIVSKNILNLYKLMRTYIIKIQHMADVQTVQKLMSLQWVNNNSDIQPKYFSIRYKQRVQNYSKKQIQNSQSLQVKNQLFYVKIQDCVLQNSNPVDRKQGVDKEQYRYSLVFKVASNQDNALLVDVIQFLTFLTVL